MMVIFNLMMMMILDIMIVVMVSYFMMMMIIFNFMMLIGIWFHDDYDDIYSIYIQFYDDDHDCRKLSVRLSGSEGYLICRRLNQKNRREERKAWILKFIWFLQPYSGYFIHIFDLFRYLTLATLFRYMWWIWNVLPFSFFIMVSLILFCLWFLHKIGQRTCFSHFFQITTLLENEKIFHHSQKNDKDFCTKFSIRPVFPSSSFRKQLLAIRLFLSSALPGRKRVGGEGGRGGALGKKGNFSSLNCIM